MKGPKQYVAHHIRATGLYEIQMRVMGTKDWGRWASISKLKFGSREGVALYVKANFNAELKGD